MAAAATQTKKSAVLNDAIQAQVAQARSVNTKKATSEFANIEANTFAKILFNPELDPNAKVSDVVRALTYAGTKEENRARVAEFEDIKEYLQNQRSEMSKAIINLTDTEAFAELKQIYEDITGSLLDFDEKMKPLTDILDAVYELRSKGVAIDTFKEIQEDRAREVELAEQRAKIEADIQAINTEISALNREVASQSKHRTFFTKKIKPDAQAKIADVNRVLGDKMVELQAVRDRVVTLNDESEAFANRGGENTQAKAKLRELLDISTDEHRTRQEDLVKSALNFVNTAKERVGAVRQHLSGMSDQVDNLGDANSNITQAYAILGEGIKGASKENQKVRAELAQPLADENLISKMSREENLTSVDQHIKLLDSSEADTMASYGDLTTQTIRINAMRDSTAEQIAQARTMHTQGVAGVADRLSVVLTAVSSAAINESSSMARDTLDKMAENTNRIAQTEVIRVASGMNEQNRAMIKAIEELASYGEVSKAATDIARAGVREMRDSLDKFGDVVKEVQETTRIAQAVHSEMDGTTDSTGTKKAGLQMPFAHK